MYAQERQQSILATARARGRVEVGSLAEELGVTVETVRRDLTALERLGVLRRVHGGALPVERLTLEPSLQSRQTQYAEAKRRIGARAAMELHDGDAVLLDAGTTTLAIVDALPPELRLTVVTNSVAVASRLSERERTELMVLGGRVRRRTGAAVGEWLAASLAEVTVDVAFLGTNGFTVEHGLTTPDQAESAAKRAMAAAARRVICVTDASKAGQVHLHRFAATEELALIISDSDLDDDTVQDFEDVGVEVART
ncbi:DeoR/GlpR family DNA-binding transcription regulator [Demequina activiva]|uniref:Lactose phosphotransferase system repressor n=1 Tax=Demequina activiva TaxID=1582364 RepID=A0A919Q0P1_9MICO|nr:DeoR/GlpR family DNA-binding transcription regulator [Demequina activiva]GIG53519.1 DeoR family transcriptional regulator [Demequina activiva]